MSIDEAISLTAARAEFVGIAMKCLGGREKDSEELGALMLAAIEQITTAGSAAYASDEHQKTAAHIARFSVAVLTIVFATTLQMAERAIANAGD